jgi:hypothetical protein
LKDKRQAGLQTEAGMILKQAPHSPANSREAVPGSPAKRRQLDFKTSANLILKQAPT